MSRHQPLSFRPKSKRFKSPAKRDAYFRQLTKRTDKRARHNRSLIALDHARIESVRVRTAAMTHCPICGSSVIKPDATMRGGSDASGPLVYYRCECRALFSRLTPIAKPADAAKPEA